MVISLEECDRQRQLEYANQIQELFCLEGSISNDQETVNSGIDENVWVGGDGRPPQETIVFYDDDRPTERLPGYPGISPTDEPTVIPPVVEPPVVEPIVEPPIVEPTPPIDEPTGDPINGLWDVPLPPEASEDVCLDKCKRFSEWMRKSGCPGTVVCRKRRVDGEPSNRKRVCDNGCVSVKRC